MRLPLGSGFVAGATPRHDEVAVYNTQMRARQCILICPRFLLGNG